MAPFVIFFNLKILSAVVTEISKNKTRHMTYINVCLLMRLLEDAGSPLASDFRMLDSNVNILPLFVAGASSGPMYWLCGPPKHSDARVSCCISTHTIKYQPVKVVPQFVVHIY